jgi:phosphate transport system substrate-binding protein
VLNFLRALLSPFCFILLYFIFLSAPSSALAVETIRINGSGSGLEMMKPLMDAYHRSHPGVAFEMHKPLGSSGAIRALLAGAIDIAVTSKPLPPETAAQGVKIRYFGKTPVAIVTCKAIYQKNISTAELENIYSGKTQKWPTGEAIRPVLRPLHDVDTMILRGLSPGMDAAITKASRQRGMIIAVTDPESDEAVAKTIGSIGTSGLTGGLRNKKTLNVIALNGVMPSIKALADGSYPLSKEIHFVFTDKLTNAAAKFLDFIYSNKGYAIAEKAGVLVTARSKTAK